MNIINDDEQKYMKTTIFKLFGHSYEIKHKKQNTITNPFIVYPSICFHILNKKIKGKNLSILIIDWILYILYYIFLMSIISFCVGIILEADGINECENGDCSYLLETFKIYDNCNQYQYNHNDNQFIQNNKYNLRYNHYNGYEGYVNNKLFHTCIRDQISFYNTTIVGYVQIHISLLYAFIGICILKIIFDIWVRIFIIALKIYDNLYNKINEEMPEVVDVV